MLLPPNNMSNTHQMIVHCSREVVERPDPILGPDPRMRILLGINYPESRPIPHSRIRVGCLRLDTNNSLPFLQLSTEHLMPQRKILSGTLRPVWTSSA